MRGFVVKLSDGQTYTEEQITWIQLKRVLEEQGLRIAEMYLQFDHQQVFLPNYAKAYFYSKKVESYLGGKQGSKQYYGVGATIQQSGEVVITWYDGENSTEEHRAVDPSKDAFIL